jgi:hypothetical protein
MKKIILITVILSYLILNVSALNPCNPTDGVCNLLCGNPSNIITDNEDWVWDEEYQCDYGFYPNGIAVIANVSCAEYNTFTESVWSDMTTDCMFYTSFPINCSALHEILCPSYEYLGRDVLYTDCICLLAVSGSCPALTTKTYGYCTTGFIEQDYSQINFSDSFYKQDSESSTSSSSETITSSDTASYSESSSSESSSLVTNINVTGQFTPILDLLEQLPPIINNLIYAIIGLGLLIIIGAFIAMILLILYDLSENLKRRL